MINFSTFITLLVAIMAIYIPLYFTLKKELEDLKINPEDNESKIINRKKKLTAINILCLTLAVIIILLYQLPTISSIIQSMEPSKFPEIIGNFFSNILPFKLGVLRHPNYRFSYITGIILSILVEYIVFQFYKDISKSKSFIRILILIVGLIIFTWGMIWCNHFISLLLAYSILHCFEFLSIIFNIISYFFILCILLLLELFFVKV